MLKGATRLPSLKETFPETVTVGRDKVTVRDSPPPTLALSVFQDSGEPLGGVTVTTPDSGECNLRVLRVAKPLLSVEAFAVVVAIDSGPPATSA
jgi:hypothetical protein